MPKFTAANHTWKQLTLPVYRIRMAEAFKDMFNEQFFDKFTKDLKLIINDFDTDEFVSHIRNDEWQSMGYKQRIAHITKNLNKLLPSDYKSAVDKILELLDSIKDTLPDFSIIDDKNFGLLALEYGAILDNYVEQYGLDDYETSIKAIEKSPSLRLANL